MLEEYPDKTPAGEVETSPAIQISDLQKDPDSQYFKMFPKMFEICPTFRPSLSLRCKGPSTMIDDSVLMGTCIKKM